MNIFTKKVSMQRSFLSIFIFLAVLGCQSVQKDSLAQSEVFSNDAFKHAIIGISVQDCESRKEIVHSNENASLHPASVMKLISTATALEILGPEYRFKTRLAYNGTIDKGILEGNLYILGGGDPTLGSMFFDSTKYFIEPWVKAVKEAGIRSISGSVISVSGQQEIPSRWVWEDIGNYYGAGATNLSVFDNQYTIHFRSAKLGQIAQISSIEPEIPGLAISSMAMGSRRSDDSAYIYGGPENYNKIIRGTIPANKMDFSIKGAMPNPPLFLAQFVTQQLINSGIQVNGTPAVSDKEPLLKVLYTTESPSLQQILQVINYASINLFAEHLPLAISNTEDTKGSTIQGIQILKDYWHSLGLDVSGLFMYDGSGLAPSNAVNASFITSLLTYMNQSSQHADIFAKCIPTAGESGTVSHFLNSSTLKGNVKAKSGSMNGVRCYAGYIMKNDKTYAFAILTNHFAGKSTTIIPFIETYLETIYEAL